MGRTLEPRLEFVELFSFSSRSQGHAAANAYILLRCTFGVQNVLEVVVLTMRLYTRAGVWEADTKDLAAGCHAAATKSKVPSKGQTMRGGHLVGCEHFNTL